MDPPLRKQIRPHFILSHARPSPVWSLGGWPKTPIRESKKASQTSWESFDLTGIKRDYLEKTSIARKAIISPKCCGLGWGFPGFLGGTSGTYAPRRSISAGGNFANESPPELRYPRRTGISSCRSGVDRSWDVPRPGDVITTLCGVLSGWVIVITTLCGHDNRG